MMVDKEGINFCQEGVYLKCKFKQKIINISLFWNKVYDLLCIFCHLAN